MQLGSKVLCALAAAGLMLAFSTSTYADSLTVKTEQGKVTGKTINDGKVKAFLGLPYAAPPVGDLRWKAPEPPAKWKGERDATKFGASLRSEQRLCRHDLSGRRPQRRLPLPQRLRPRRRHR